MTTASAPGPSYTAIELTGAPDRVSRIVAAIGSTGEIIFDSRSEPNPRDEVTALVRVLTHDPESTAPAGTAAVTVQAVLDVDTAAWPGLPAPSAVEQIEAATAAALRDLTGGREARSRVIAILPLPPSATNGREGGRP
ncbi:hypothetical protein PUR49_11145 [Streptomyces sp. BE147]|uniref:hypothetical protein n=1 Tax=Streptomyces sp. BE147 TaxID=3002524 RepID=UPI002E76696E|nr:hypothetical protein [Streptomyces sp. BE147]MEE1737051.1 hypothetical protein [Streptomyces sp. BE147]